MIVVITLLSVVFFYEGLPFSYHDDGLRNISLDHIRLPK